MGVEGVFANAHHTESLPSGKTIFRAGDAGTVMYGVIAGAVDLHRGLTLVHTVRPGEVFGELSIIDGSPRSMTAVTTGDTVLAVIDRDQFVALVERTPTFALDVMESLAARMRSFDDGIR